MEVSADLHFYNNPWMIGSTLEIEPSKIMDEISVRGLGIRWYVDQSSPNYRILKQKILIAQNLCVWEPR